MTHAGQPNVECIELFAVPIILATDILPEELHGELVNWVLGERETDSGITRSNAGGWHSKPDLPVRGVPALDQLFQAIVAQVRDLHTRVSTNASEGDYSARFVLQAWATVMESGHYTHVHDHADAHWSAVYYVDDGSVEGVEVGGKIAWLNPIGPHRTMLGANLTPTTFELQPRTGLLVAFPGWLRHLVQPYFGQRPRIAIAANIEVRRT